MKAKTRKKFLFSVKILIFKEIISHQNNLANFLEKLKNILQKSWNNGQENFDVENRK